MQYLGSFLFSDKTTVDLAADDRALNNAVYKRLGVLFKVPIFYNL